MLPLLGLNPRSVDEFLIYQCNEYVSWQSRVVCIILNATIRHIYSTCIIPSGA